MITQDLLHELFDYQDGNLIRKTKVSTRSNIGDIAGTLHKATGYRIIKINKKPYKEHRLIWIYHNGDIKNKLQIDHINGIKNDNHIENLRLVTNQENSFNAKAKGYCWCKRTKKWSSYIYINSKHKSLGYYDNEKDAREAYLIAKEKYHVIVAH